MNKTINVTFEDITFEVSGDYQPETPSDLEYPGDKEYFIIDKICLEGNNITCITSNQFDARLEDFINEDLTSYINE